MIARGPQSRRTIPSTGRRFRVRQSWREIDPDSPLPSASEHEPLAEADTEGTPDGDIALLYPLRNSVRIDYVDAAYCEEVRNG